MAVYPWSQYQEEEFERRRNEQESLRKHQAKFNCACCFFESRGPEGTKCDNGSWLWDWEKPTGLFRCTRCGRWVCNNCRDKQTGVCLTCTTLPSRSVPQSSESL